LKKELFLVERKQTGDGPINKNTPGMMAHRKKKEEKKEESKGGSLNQ